MENQPKLPVHNAASLKVGSIIKLAGNELKITYVVPHDGMVTFAFDKPWWNPLFEEWTWMYRCNSGFCFEVIQL